MTTYTWTVQSGDFNAPASWTADAAPLSSGDSARITIAGDAVITGSAVLDNLLPTEQSGTLTFTGTLQPLVMTALGNFALTSGAAIEVTASANIANAHGNAAILVDGAGSKFSTGGNVNMGNAGDIAFAATGGTLEATNSGYIDIAANSGALNTTPLCTLQVDATSTIEIGGSGLGTAGAITIDRESALVGAGSIVGPLVLTDNSSMTAEFGALVVNGPVTGDGEIDLSTNGTLELMSSFPATATVSFTSDQAANEELILDQPSTFAGQIAVLPAIATIDLVGVSAESPTLTPSGGGVYTLEVPLQGGPVLTTTIIGTPGNPSLLSSQPDGHGGTDIILPCFAAGTRLLTDAGEVAVEALRVGQRLVARSGQGPLVQPIRWIGSCRVELDGHADPAAVMPVRIRAGAFGAGRAGDGAPMLPHRDLLLSPDHSVWLQDEAGAALVPIRLLVNGATIVQEKPRGSVTYYHVELARHDVLLAEGLAAESYLDTGNRAAFSGHGAVAAADPEFAARCWDERACAPLLLDGPRVAAFRAGLLSRAGASGYHLTEDPGLRVEAAGCPLALRPLGPGRWQFLLPARTDRVRLLSRSLVPAQLDPGAEDRRWLGVPVLAVLRDRRPFDLAGAAFGAGFHRPETAAGTAWRWTDGDSELRFAPDRWDSLIELRTAHGWCRYWIDTPDAPAQERCLAAPGAAASRAAPSGRRSMSTGTARPGVVRLSHGASADAVRRPAAARGGPDVSADFTLRLAHAGDKSLTH